MTTSKFRTAYDKRARVPIDLGGESRTKQSFADESNINAIMRKYEKTGVLEHLNKHQGNYGDFADLPTYQEALNQISEAQEMFAEIPATIRLQFENDPGKFLAFVQDPANVDQMVEMGLAIPEPNEGKGAAPAPKAPKAAPAAPAPEAAPSDE